MVRFNPLFNLKILLFIFSVASSIGVADHRESRTKAPGSTRTQAATSNDNVKLMNCIKSYLDRVGGGKYPPVLAVDAKENIVVPDLKEPAKRAFLLSSQGSFRIDLPDQNAGSQSVSNAPTVIMHNLAYPSDKKYIRLGYIVMTDQPMSSGLNNSGISDTVNGQTIVQLQPDVAGRQAVKDYLNHTIASVKDRYGIILNSLEKILSGEQKVEPQYKDAMMKSTIESAKKMLEMKLQCTSFLTEENQKLVEEAFKTADMNHPIGRKRIGS